jgi:hydroxymethylpyrimidine pyrophosphatase-like HAD family hydrolase
MNKSYEQITPELARQIRLIMADVDGTLIPSGDDSISSVVLEAISRLQEQGIIVGLVSGRTLPGLESLASRLGITGPIIAENGGVAKLKANGALVDLGYSRQPALESLEKLKALFPDAIKEREDNKERVIDVVIWSYGVATDELRKHLDDTQLLDSGYILHLMQKGVSKGRTLMRLLGEIGDGNFSPAEVTAFGDSLTDISLFELFPNSVLIINPNLPVEQRELMHERARYMSDLPFDEGFAEVAFHIIKVRGSR